MLSAFRRDNGTRPSAGPADIVQKSDVWLKMSPEISDFRPQNNVDPALFTQNVFTHAVRFP